MWRQFVICLTPDNPDLVLETKFVLFKICELDKFLWGFTLYILIELDFFLNFTPEFKSNLTSTSVREGQITSVGSVWER